jgi:galactokinase
MPGRAANYLLGVVAQFVDRSEYVPNLDLALTSTVPIGSGLASSAAIEVAFATLLEQITQTPLEGLDKARLCQNAEHGFAGTPCGIMDMYVASKAEAGSALLIDCRSNTSQLVPLPHTGEAAVLIADTGVKHELSSGAYACRRVECESVARKLRVRCLRDATLDGLNAAALSVDDRKRALHVIAENTRTVLAAQALAAGNVQECGALMFASHDSLRDLFEVSCRELDVLVEAAADMRGRGVHGSRMTGGGFGGCTVTLCQAAAVEGVQGHLRHRFQEAFGREPAMFTTNATGGARHLRLP